jgi:(2Fe-2S) ferredoxin
LLKGTASVLRAQSQVVVESQARIISPTPWTNCISQIKLHRPALQAGANHIVIKAGCLDHCAHGPSVVIYPEGVWYQVKTAADVTEIMERHVLKGEVVTRLVMPDHPAPTHLPLLNP